MAAIAPSRSAPPRSVPVRSAPRAVSRSLPRPTWSQLALTVTLAGVFVLLTFAAPTAIGADWDEVGRALRSVDLRWWPLLTLVWAAGLWAYGVVMTASMPGLSARRALSLNLGGSAVANSLPLGGAVSLGLTTAMARSWGFTARSVSTFLTLTNIWNVLSRLVFGVAAGLWFLTAGPGAMKGLTGLAVTAGVIVTISAVGALLLRTRAVVRIGAVATLLHEAFRSRFRPSARRRGEGELARALLSLRRQTGGLLRASWLQLTLGMTGYFVLLAALLALCLRSLGTTPSLMLVLAAVGIERLVTALPITPGGAGAAELSLVACLTAGGVSGVHALAAALLFRFFTYFAEIPVGAAVALGWHLQRTRVSRIEPIA